MTENTIVETTEAVAETPKAPSKKSQAFTIFAEKLTERSQGLFSSNKEFRRNVLEAFKSQMGVSIASAATMYNTAKKAAEEADANVGLGRDPKKEKAPSTGKRGRPVVSKNKPKVVVTITTPTEEAAPIEEHA